MADPNYINSQSVDWNKFYQGITPKTPAMQTSGWGKPVGSTPSYLRQGVSGVNFNPGVGFVPGTIPPDRLPRGTAGLPNPSPGSGLTPQQLQQMGGWATDPLTGQLAYTQPSQNGAVNAVNGMAQNVPLPRHRPPNAPTLIDMAAINAQSGANPGMGGAMIGNGVMSPDIPPQQPPADGSSPLPKWRGDIFGPMGGPSGRAGRTRSAGGYQYVNGRRVGYAPQSIGGSIFTPMSGTSAYSLANMAGQIAAQQKRATLNGVGTNGYTYRNGVNMGYGAAEQAARTAQGKAIGNANRKSANPTYNVSGSNNSFEPKSVQDSVRWQTGY